MGSSLRTFHLLAPASGTEGPTHIRPLGVYTLVLLLACTRAPAVEAPIPVAQSEADRAAATITAQDLYDRISYLASDSLRGRNTPSPGLELAAAYIADQFRTFGLRPAGDSNTFIQRWPYSQTRIDITQTSLQLTVGDTTFRPALGSDYFVIPAREPTVTGALRWGGVAEVASGSAAAAGQIPIVYVPGAIPDSAWNVRFSAAFSRGLRAGAPAVVFVLAPAFDEALFAQFASQVGGDEASLFVIGMRFGAAAPILARAGVDTAALRAAEPPAARSLDGTQLSLAIGRATQDSRPPNVAAILAGSDPELREEFIVFSAHMDHIGVGRPDATGDSIFNGADDDASGTAVVLEVAQAFASLRSRPARSILFLAVSGEEKGLLGSAWFTKHLPVPAGNIVANINLDMLGRNAPDTLVAIGQDYSSLGPLVQSVALAHPSLGLVVAPDLWPEEQLFFRSDHFNFAKIGVPALYFTTGLHPQYHQPSDEADLIDRDKIERVARLVYRFAYEVAMEAERPTWTAKGQREVGAMTIR
ncbi:MAG: M28 family peptidase [Longimicrobiales bacterium]